MSDPTLLPAHMANRIEADPDGCWLWMGYRMPLGYGQIHRDGRARLVHRVVYELLVEPISAGFEACHSCDNPPCCNPDHIFIGTHADNMRDMAVKDRDRGPRRLSDDDIRKIRGRYRSGIRWSNADELSEEFGTTRLYIQQLAAGRKRRKVR